MRSEEFPGEVEAEVEAVLEAAACELRERRPLSVVDVDLKEVTAGPLLDGEPECRLVRAVTRRARGHLADQVNRRTHADAPTDADKERVAIDVEVCRRVVNPDGCRVDRQ